MKHGFYRKQLLYGNLKVLLWEETDISANLNQKISLFAERIDRIDFIFSLRSVRSAISFWASVPSCFRGRAGFSVWYLGPTRNFFITVSQPPRVIRSSVIVSSSPLMPILLYSWQRSSIDTFKFFLVVGLNANRTKCQPDKMPT